MQVDVDVQKASVTSHCQRLQNAVPLAWQVEVKMHGLSVNCNLATAWLDVNDRARVLAFTVAPCPRVFVDLVRPLLLRQHSAEVKQVNAVELGKVIRVQIASSVAEAEDVVVDLLSELGQEVAQVVLVVGILLE